MPKSKYPKVLRKAVHHFYSPERSPHANLKFLLGKFPEGTWGELSLRKQFCLEYCKWLCFPRSSKKEEETMRVYNVMKHWRKVDRRIGTKRTLLERTFRVSVLKIVRKLRGAKKNSRHSKKLHDRGTGNLVKVNREKAYLENLKLGPKVAALTGTRTEDWIIWSPEGEVYFVRNLYAFCKEKGMDDSHLGKTAKYPGKYYRGWRAAKRTRVTEWYGAGGFD
jgi:hypothetical protein